MECVIPAPSTLSPDNQCVLSGFPELQNARVTPLRRFVRGQITVDAGRHWYTSRAQTLVGGLPAGCQSCSRISIILPRANSQAGILQRNRAEDGSSHPPQLHSTPTLALSRCCSVLPSRDDEFIYENPEGLDVSIIDRNLIGL